MVDLKGINLATQTSTHADGSSDCARWQALIETSIDGGGVRDPLQKLDSGAQHEFVGYIEALDRG
jgi:hypothetical protein